MAEALLEFRDVRAGYGEAVVLEAKGRHDPCVLPRAVPMVEAMALLVVADHWLRQRAIDPGLGRAASDTMRSRSE